MQVFTWLQTSLLLYDFLGFKSQQYESALVSALTGPLPCWPKGCKEFQDIAYSNLQPIFCMSDSHGVMVGLLKLNIKARQDIPGFLTTCASEPQLHVKDFSACHFRTCQSLDEL